MRLDELADYFEKEKMIQQGLGKCTEEAVLDWFLPSHAATQVAFKDKGRYTNETLDRLITECQATITKANRRIELYNKLRPFVQRESEMDSILRELDSLR